MSQDGYVYPQVRALATSYLPGSREREAKLVDGMLATRDAQIDQLKADVRDKDRAVERYMEENAEVRGFIGRLRAILADGFRSGPSGAVIAIQRALALDIPGAGAKSRQPVIHDARMRVQLCASCDRKNLCPLLHPGSAPCGQNRLMLAEVDGGHGRSA